MQRKNSILIERACLAALTEARRGVRLKHGGPFGAVVLKDDRVVAKGHNTVLKDNDPTCHAEINAIRRAARRLGSPHLKNCLLVTTSEPCPMCLAAAYWAGISSILYYLPRETAAAFGFSDEYMYREFKRAAGKRSVRAVRMAEFGPSAAGIFREWKRRGGRLY